MDWTLYQKSIELQEARRVDEAMAILRALVGTSSDPIDNELIFLGIAHCLRDAGRSEEAREYVIKAYNALEKRHPSYPSVMFVDASIEDELGNHVDALAKLDLILEQFPSVLADSRYEDLKIKIVGLRGIKLVDLRRYAEALPLLKLAIGRKYWRERTVFYLGSCFYHLRNFEGAERTLTDALALDLSPTYQAFTHYYLGLAHLSQRHYTSARQEFEWCLRFDKNGNITLEQAVDGLVKASKALGLNADVAKYSALLNRC